MREVLTGHVTRGDLPGLVTLVARRGEVHVEAIGSTETGGGGPMRRDSIFRIASVTKQITAAAAMILIEECRLRLDDPVDELLPELADRKVLRRPDGPLDDTVPAHRPITPRDLLTFRMGIGAVMAQPGEHPIQRAMDETGLAPAPQAAPIEPDECAAYSTLVSGKATITKDDLTLPEAVRHAVRKYRHVRRLPDR
ncbi:serine hydrolase domain-containing protein [Streptosporangium lutulentum]